jgi:hypothetical protein
MLWDRPSPNEDFSMRFLTKAGLLATITTGAAGLMYGADAYTPLWLYQGTWKATSQSAGGAPTSKIINNECARIGQFFGCQQTIDGKAGALILFLPVGQQGHYYTQAVTMEGLATGRGELLIEGDRWTYSSKSKQDGKDVFHRTTNDFTGANRIHFEQAESADGEHSVVKSSGDEEKVEQRSTERTVVLQKRWEDENPATSDSSCFISHRVRGVH